MAVSSLDESLFLAIRLVIGTPPAMAEDATCADQRGGTCCQLSLTWHGVIRCQR